jgi:hypothetical protein
MDRVDSRVYMGATLLVAPSVKGGIQISGLVSILLVVVIALVGLMLFRGSRPGPSGPGSGDGWRKGPPPPDPPSPDGPRGGIPLDDAVPARVRLRGEARLVDVLPRRERRPAREPEPERTPERA